MPINKTADIGKDTLTNSDLSFVPTTDFTYKISHDLIVSDGDYDIKIDLTYKGKTASVTCKVKITGIDVAKTSARDQDLVVQEAMRISDLWNNKKIEKDQTSIAENQLESELQANFDSNFKYSVIHDLVSKDGDVQVKLKVGLQTNSSVTKEASFTVKVEGIDQAIKNNKDTLDEESIRITSQSYKRINKTNDIAKDSLTNSDLEYGMEPGFSYQVLHDPITKDGKYYINISITYKGISKDAEYGIEVVGINMGKVRTALQDDLEKDFKELIKIQNTKIDKNTPLEKYYLEANEIPGYDKVYETLVTNYKTSGKIQIALTENGKTEDKIEFDQNVNQKIFVYFVNGQNKELIKEFKFTLIGLDETNDSIKKIKEQINSKDSNIEIVNQKSWKEQISKNDIKFLNEQGNLEFVLDGSPLVDEYGKAEIKFKIIDSNSNLESILITKKIEGFRNKEDSINKAILDLQEQDFIDLINNQKSPSTIEKQNVLEVINKISFLDGIKGIDIDLFPQNLDGTLEIIVKNDGKTKTIKLNGFAISTWEDAEEFNITDGFGGTIFEDSSKNVWAMRGRTGLQVLKWNKDTQEYADSWEKAQGSNITDGFGGTIFEDSQGNLWSIGNKTGLQVMKIKK